MLGGLLVGEENIFLVWISSLHILFCSSFFHLPLLLTSLYFPPFYLLLPLVPHHFCDQSQVTLQSNLKRKHRCMKIAAVSVLNAYSTWTHIQDVDAVHLLFLFQSDTGGHRQVRVDKGWTRNCVLASLFFPSRN